MPDLIHVKSKKNSDSGSMKTAGFAAVAGIKKAGICVPAFSLKSRIYWIPSFFFTIDMMSSASLL